MIVLELLTFVLAIVAVMLWLGVWYVHRAFPIPPLVDIQNHPGVRRPITRQDISFEPGAVWPVHGITSASAYMVIPSLTAYGPPR